MASFGKLLSKFIVKYKHVELIFALSLLASITCSDPGVSRFSSRITSNKLENLLGSNRAHSTKSNVNTNVDTTESSLQNDTTSIDAISNGIVSALATITSSNVSFSVDNVMKNVVDSFNEYVDIINLSWAKDNRTNDTFLQIKFDFSEDDDDEEDDEEDGEKTVGSARDGGSKGGGGKGGGGGGKGGGKKKKKKGGFMKYMPMMPFMIQAALTPMAIGMMKFMLLKSMFIGKLAIFLLIFNGLRRYNSETQRLTMEHYGYTGSEEPGAWIN